MSTCSETLLIFWINVNNLYLLQFKNIYIYIYIYIYIFQTNKVCLKASILGETSQRRSASVTKFSQPRV